MGERMDKALLDRLESQTAELAGAGLFKRERVIASPQDPVIRLEDGREVLNFCANNYLGLAHHPAIITAAHAALDRYGYGMASVRFICGTQTVHRELERRLSAFLGTEDTILYSSCFDANGGLFETLTGEEDAIISDALNHASIIDGIRLSKAKRLRYDNADLGQLEARLREAEGARSRLVVTDGYSRWTAPSRRCPESASSPTATARSSSSMIRTRPGSWAVAGAARTSIAASWDASTC